MTERDDGCVRWFGESWGAPINVDCERTATPVGKVCLQCDEMIAADDRGVTMIGVGFEDRQGYVLPGSRIAVHIDCHIWSVLGVHAMVARKPFTDTARIKADGVRMLQDAAASIDGVPPGVTLRPFTPAERAALDAAVAGGVVSDMGNQLDGDELAARARGEGDDDGQ